MTINPIVCPTCGEPSTPEVDAASQQAECPNCHNLISDREVFQQQVMYVAAHDPGLQPLAVRDKVSLASDGLHYFVLDRSGDLYTIQLTDGGPTKKIHRDELILLSPVP
jgi:hypothetical protein